MKCERCGKQLGNNIYKYNGMVLCPECAQVLGVPDLMNGAFKFLDSDIMSAIPKVFGNLDFSPSRTQIKCAKCGTSLRDFETNGILGCIECYNTFSDQISRFVMKSQSGNEHVGRKPSEVADSSSWKKFEEVEDYKDEELNSEAKAEADKIVDKLQKYEHCDLGMLSDEELKEAIKIAVEAEDYLQAARFRDELKGREGN